MLMPFLESPAIWLTGSNMWLWVENHPWTHLFSLVYLRALCWVHSYFLSTSMMFLTFSYQTEAHSTFMHSTWAGRDLQVLGNSPLIKPFMVFTYWFYLYQGQKSDWSAVQEILWKCWQPQLTQIIVFLFVLILNMLPPSGIHTSLKILTIVTPYL